MMMMMIKIPLGATAVFVIIVLPFCDIFPNTDLQAPSWLKHDMRSDE